MEPPAVLQYVRLISFVHWILNSDRFKIGNIEENTSIMWLMNFEKTSMMKTMKNTILAQIDRLDCNTNKNKSF